MRVANGDGSRVGGVIGAWNACKLQQDTYHLSDLVLFRVSVPSHCELDLIGREFIDGNVMLIESEHENAASVRHRYGRRPILPKEQRFHRRFSRVIGREQNADLLMKQAQAICEGCMCRGADDIADEGSQLPLLLDENRVPGNCHTRIDAENDALGWCTRCAPHLFL